jgi:hypothetical protein
MITETTETALELTDAYRNLLSHQEQDPDYMQIVQDLKGGKEPPPNIILGDDELLYHSTENSLSLYIPKTMQQELSYKRHMTAQSLDIKDATRHTRGYADASTGRK